MRYRAGGKTISCPCCQNTTFNKDYRQLNSRGATLFGMDWANKNAVILVCKQCTHIAWFMGEPAEDK